jgi:hypothetical protein
MRRLVERRLCSLGTPITRDIYEFIGERCMGDEATSSTHIWELGWPQIRYRSKTETQMVLGDRFGGQLVGRQHKCQPQAARVVC